MNFAPGGKIKVTRTFILWFALGVMQLSRTDAHQSAGHHGGVLYWGICNNKAYPKWQPKP